MIEVVPKTYGREDHEPEAFVFWREAVAGQID
jgi:hypothetical protein